MNHDNVRQRIIEASRDRFYAMGFSKVTMDELVGELGISKKTMYKYFSSKDHLIDAITEWQMIRALGKVKAIVDPPIDFIEKMHNLWAFIGETYSRMSKQYHDDMRRFRPDLWRRIEEFRRKHLIENAAKLIEEGIKRGVFRKDVNKEILVLLYVSAIQGVMHPEILVEHSFSAEEAFKTVLRVMFDGILTDQAREEYRSKCIDPKTEVRAT